VDGCRHIFSIRRRAYLGTQGDIWDAQKDMGIAFVGAITGMISNT
jgi:putative membrane protein